MTDNQTKIKELIGLGDKANQDRWTCEEGLPYIVKDSRRREVIARFDYSPECKNFIIASANARPAIKAMLAENERMREALFGIGTKAYFASQNGVHEQVIKTLVGEIAEESDKALTTEEE